MKYKIELVDLINQLSFWHNKTNDECTQMATGEYGIDAEQALMNML
jgi:hypothetical protein